MGNLLSLAVSQPSRKLEPGDVLITQGSVGGDLFVLESGRLVVERDGVMIAAVASPGALLGEMSVLLGTPVSATVRAEGPATVRVIRDARSVLENDPGLTFLVASLVAARLDATSAVLVELKNEHKGKAEQSILARIVSTLHLPAGGNYMPMNRGDLFGGNDELVRNFPGG